MPNPHIAARISKTGKNSMGALSCVLVTSDKQGAFFFDLFFFATGTERCSVQDKARIIVKVVGVKGMILEMSEGSVGSGYFYAEERDESVHLPSMEIARDSGKELEDALRNREVVLVRMKTPG